MKYTRFGNAILLCLATLLLSGFFNNTASGAVSLAGSGPAQSSLYVKPVEGLKDDFIRGVDVSSYMAEKESGVVYRDFAGEELTDDGFFKLLADSGVNWVRLRVWNDPADRSGNSYGGGHNDLNTAISIGKLATKAGLKVCIDFHYSDFWADPNKQAVPKEWSHMTLENKTAALGAFTADSLTRLLDSGVDVQMVQIGNEINNGLAGETKEDRIYQLLKAGSTAVRTVSSQKKHPVQIAVHYTNPDGPDFYGYCGKLVDAGVDFDVFAVSYYPYWHDKVDKLTGSLDEIVQRYGKKVMVAETSYPYTLDDGDGFPNTIGDGSTKLRYSVSPQGQANLIHNLAASLMSLDGKGIGLFYWEPAWIPVQAIRKDTPNAPQIYEQNQQLWEKYGSGWATSYAVKYDPEAKESYGGSSWDNQALFDFDGNPLESLRTFRYLFGGTTAKNKLASVNDIVFESGIGQPVSMPATVPGTLLDDTKRDIPVVWDQSQVQAAQQGGLGEYWIAGVATDTDGTTYPLTCKLQIKKINYIKNPGFEDDDMSMWTITGDGVGRLSDNNHRSGDYSLKFHSEKKISFTAEQTITDIPAGTYRLGAWLEGGDGGSGASFEVYISVNGTESSASAVLTGWQQWSEAVVGEVNIPAGATVLVGVRGDAAPKAWGAFDDLTLVESGDSGGQADGQQFINGDFEAQWAANGQIPGWSITFRDWGEGDNKAQYTLKTDKYSVNTTQVLNLSNNTGKENAFSVTQSFVAPETSSYVTALDFEGENAPKAAYLSVNGEKTALSSFDGWNHWSHAVSGAVSVKQGDQVTIEIGGTVPNGWWMDVDNITFAQKKNVTSKTQPPTQGSVIPTNTTGAVKAPPTLGSKADSGYGELINGDFDQGFDGLGEPSGWNVWFSEKGEENAGTSWEISQATDNTPNTTNKLSLSNKLGHKATYRVSQEINHVKAGTYTAALLFEGDSDDRASGSVLSVNGMETELGSCLGWKHWKQVILPGITVEEGGTVQFEVHGTLTSGQWLDLDHIQLVPSETFQESEGTWKKETEKSRQAQQISQIKDAAPVAVTSQIQNGTFGRGVEWNVNGYPDGYVEGWTLPEADWDTWIYDGDQGKFNITNISDSKEVREFEIKQKVSLKPGSYQIDSVIGGHWSDSVFDNEVCIRVAQPDGVLIGERYWKAGYGQAVSDEFIIDSPMEVTVSFTFMLSGGHNASLDNVAIYSYPAKVKLKSAVQMGGRKGKDDTTKIKVTFDRPIFGLEKEDFSVEGATVTDMENMKNGTYILFLDDLKEADGNTVALTVTNPEGTVISSRRQKVKIYRDNDGIPFQLTNGDFSMDVSWPDGHLEGWQLPETDWNTWSYQVSDGHFYIKNISENGGNRSFKMHQVIRLEPGTYYLEADSPGAEDTENANGITISARAGNRTLAQVSSYTGCGSMSSNEITLEKETSVEIGIAFSLPTGRNAVLDYVAITGIHPATPSEPELADHLVNGDFSIGIDWSQGDYPNGYLEGWKLPASVDWNLWEYHTDDGNFALHNKSTGETGTFSISQPIRMTAGTYKLNAASPWTWDDKNPTGITLTAESGGKTLAELQEAPGCGDFGGAEFTLSNDATVTVTIRFNLPSGKSAAIDDVTVEPVTPTPPAPPTPPEPEPADHLVNGDFSVGIDWSQGDYPNGYLEGWKLPASVDWNLWEYHTDDGNFALHNKSTGETGTFSISQPIRMTAGTYKLNAASPWTWDDKNPTGITLTAESGGKTLAELQEAPGCGDFGGAEFTLSTAATVTVTIRFSLPADKWAAIDDVTVEPVTPTPPFVNPIANGDFSQDMTWNPTTLPGWTIPADNWGVWESVIDNRAFKVINKKTDEDTTAISYEISQNITLMPGTYKIKGLIPKAWIALDNAEAKVTLTVGDLVTVESASLTGWTENQSMESNTFQVPQETTEAVKVKFDIPSGKTDNASYVAVDDIEIVQVQ